MACKRGTKITCVEMSVFPAGLHMARKDWQAAGQTMLRAIEAKRYALGPSHPDVAQSVLRLATIHCESGQHKDGIRLLQKELKFFTGEGQASSPGRYRAPCSTFGVPRIFMQACDCQACAAGYFRHVTHHRERHILC